MQREHIDLFSGLGGFALAARANGVRTVQFVEIDPRCRAFLEKAWPEVPVHNDIRTFGLAVSAPSGRRQIPAQNSTGWKAGQFVGAGVWLLTGGVPCQPASRAGKQRGKEDDRWLWPEALRVIAAVNPTWALLENPPGIGDVGLDGILSALEAQGYEVRVVSIPACAVGAPHRRERYWIVAHRNESRSKGTNVREERGEADGLRAEHSKSDLGDTQPEREQRGAMSPRREEGPFGGNDRPAPSKPWSDHVWLSCADGKVRRAPDDSFGLVDGLHRSLLGALGNSIVWPVASEIIRAMILSESEDLHQM